jgi:hypothetical protein
MSPNYYQRRRLKAREKAMRGVEARQRKRLADCESAPGWRRVRTLLIAVYAHDDGRHVGLRVNGGEWYRCGSERAVRAALARMLYKTSATAPCGAAGLARKSFHRASNKPGCGPVSCGAERGDYRRVG